MPELRRLCARKRKQSHQPCDSQSVAGYLAKCVMECSLQAPCVAFTRCNFVTRVISVLRLVQHVHRLHLVLPGTPVCISTCPSKASFCCSHTPASCTAVGVVPGCSPLDLMTDLHDWCSQNIGYQNPRKVYKSDNVFAVIS